MTVNRCPNDELREILASAGAELLSRRTGDGNSASKQHLYRIAMRRTAKAEPQAFRFTQVDNVMVRLPLPLDRVIGTSGKVIGGEFQLDDGDVVQKVAASGLVSYLIAWQGVLEARIMTCQEFWRETPKPRRSHGLRRSFAATEPF